MTTEQLDFADEIEEIFKTISNDTNSELSKTILVNCQHIEWHPDKLDFRYKGIDYELKITQGSKVWDADKAKTKKMSAKEAAKLFK